MISPIQITISNRQIGRIDFAESDSALREQGIRRTADGFVFTLPATITLDWQNDDWMPFVSNLHAQIFVDDNSGTELGMAFDRKIYTAAKPRIEASLALEWRGSFEALQLLEKRRDGRPPKLYIQCFGEAAPIFTSPEGQHVRGVPTVRFGGGVHLAYPQDTWSSILDDMGVTGSVLVEMPVRKNFPEAWREIYAGLHEARRNLARGGSDGWKGCVAVVRLALEKWRELEPEELGPAGQAANSDARQARTKAQRIDALRLHLYQLANLPHHSPADEWRREDAVLAFTMLAALLAERNP